MAAVLLVVAAGLAWLFLFSSVFVSREVVVTGTKLLTVDQVRSVAAVPMGQPLLRLDTGAIEARLRAEPEVRSADVQVDLPNSVRIAVDERVAVYQMLQDGSHSWVDDQGVVFRTGQARSEAMPVVTVAKPETRLLKDVSTVLTGMPDDVAAKVTTVSANSVDRIVVELDDERRIVWGSAEQTPLKAQVIGPLLNVEAKVYDVSAPEHPTTR